MKHFVVLALVVCLSGCGGTVNPASPNRSCNSGSQQAQQRQSPSTTPATYDMLSWMTMDPTLAASHHISGTANPIYTSVCLTASFGPRPATVIPGTFSFIRIVA